MPGKVKKVSKMTKMTILVILTYFGTFCEAQLTPKGEKIGFCQNRKNVGNYTQKLSPTVLVGFTTARKAQKTPQNEKIDIVIFDFREMVLDDPVSKKLFPKQGYKF